MKKTLSFALVLALLFTIAAPSASASAGGLSASQGSRVSQGGYGGEGRQGNADSQGDGGSQGNGGSQGDGGSRGDQAIAGEPGGENSQGDGGSRGGQAVAGEPGGEGNQGGGTGSEDEGEGDPDGGDTEETYTVVFIAPDGATVLQEQTIHKNEAVDWSVVPAVEYDKDTEEWVGWHIDGSEGLFAEEGMSVTQNYRLVAFVAIKEPLPKAIEIVFAGDTAAVMGGTASYTVSMNNPEKLTTATFWIEVDSDYLAGGSFEGLNGFQIQNGVRWENTAGSIWAACVTLTRMDGGVSGDGKLDVLAVTFAVLNKHGMSEIKLAKVLLSGYDESGEVFYPAFALMAEPLILEVAMVFSLYDLNKDGIVDQRDLTIAQRHFMAAEGDRGWDTAKIADVNGDGLVDIEDFVMILQHIEW